VQRCPALQVWQLAASGVPEREDKLRAELAHELESAERLASITSPDHAAWSECEASLERLLLILERLPEKGRYTVGNRARTELESVRRWTRVDRRFVPPTSPSKLVAYEAWQRERRKLRIRTGVSGTLVAVGLALIVVPWAAAYAIASSCTAADDYGCNYEPYEAIYLSIAGGALIIGGTIPLVIFGRRLARHNRQAPLPRRQAAWPPPSRPRATPGQPTGHPQHPPHASCRDR